MENEHFLKLSESIVLKDFSGLEAFCGNVYIPKTIGEIIKILKLANKNKLKVVPIGGKTGTSGGYSGKIDIGIDLKKFSYIHKSPDDTFIVGAGTRVGQFNKYLKSFGLIVPMTEAPNATIGGSVAMDNPGKPYHEFSLGKCVSSITIISPVGEKISLRQNSQTSSLFNYTIGGEGITGIITEVEFKPIRLKKRENINLLFKPNDFDILQSFWNEIIKFKSDNLMIMRGVVFPLGLLQVRTMFEDQDVLIEFREKIKYVMDSYDDIERFEGHIPIGEMIIDQLCRGLNVKYKFFPAISKIDYNDKKLNDFLINYVKKEKTVGMIEEIEIGAMRVIKNSTHVFNGRIPDFTKIKKISNLNCDLFILNYGGSNVCGGTHIAFLGNDLKKIRFHMENIFKILHFNFPFATVIEHKASVVRGSQIFFMEGEKGMLSRKNLRDRLDPNRIIATSALQNIDQFDL